MKKIYTLALAGILSGAAYGQQIQKRHSFGNDINNHVRALKAPHMGGSAVAKSSAAMVSGYIDYSWFAANDLTYVWQFNSLYTSADTSMSYACVALNQFGVFNDYADNTLDYDYMGQNVWPSTMVIDSLFAVVSHENNTGSNNIWGMDLVKLNTSGAPTTSSAVLWGDRDTVTTTQSPGGNWVGTGATFILSYAPNYTVNLGTDKVGINVIYQAPDGDTSSIAGSSIDDGSGGTMTQAAYATSYMRYPPFISGITANRNIGYGSPVGSAGWIEVQDWEIWAKVSFDDATIGFNEINKKDFKVYQNAPNPFTGKTTIRYSIGKNIEEVKFQMYDLSGRLVMDKTEKDLSAGDHSIVVDGSQYAKGVYVYSFDVNGVKVTKRLVIQ